MKGPDLVVLVPSRGRPANVDRLVRACALTCQADTRLHFAFDLDDPCLQQNIKAAGRHVYVTGPRDHLSGWTNKLMARLTGPLGADGARYGSMPGALASIGDDMIPVTDGWDAQLLDALAKIGGGFVYPNDQRRDDIPEAVIVTTAIVTALGWFCQPTLTHWFVDCVWRDLGHGTGHLGYCRDVIVRHDHPSMTGEPGDATYTEAATQYGADLNAYQRWRLRRMATDITAVRRVLAAPPDPV